MPPSLRERCSRASLRSRRSLANSTSPRETIIRGRARAKVFAKRIVARARFHRHRTRRSTASNDSLLAATLSNRSQTAVSCLPPSSTQTFPFLNLPYEIREDIYLYAFASSRIHFTRKENDMSWDALALACRQIKTELEDIPLRRLMIPIEGSWARSGAESPLHVSVTTPSGEGLRIIVRVPRSALATYSWTLFRLLSALLSFKTERTTIALYDDGTPLLALEHIKAFFRLLQNFMFLRSTSYKYYSQCNTVNAKEVVLLWEGHLDYDWPNYSDIVLGMVDTARQGSYIPACYVSPRTTFTMDDYRRMRPIDGLQGVVISSETRFRPHREPKTSRVRFLTRSLFREVYCKDVE
jgi:hypothetical protein